MNRSDLTFVSGSTRMFERLQTKSIPEARESDKDVVQYQATA